jgi:hypothetical protein
LIGKELETMGLVIRWAISGPVTTLDGKTEEKTIRLTLSLINPQIPLTSPNSNRPQIFQIPHLRAYEKEHKDAEHPAINIGPMPGNRYRSKQNRQNQVRSSRSRSHFSLAYPRRPFGGGPVLIVWWPGR